MKKTLYLCMALLLSAYLPMHAQRRWSIPVMPNGPQGGYIETEHGSTAEVLYSTQFPKAGYFPVYYVHFPAGTFRITSANQCQADVSRMDPQTILSKGAAANDFTLKAPEEGWYRIALKGGTPGQEIHDFNVTAQGAVNGEVFLAGWRSIPSLHLNGFSSSDNRMPRGDRYDWIYNEVQIPVDADFKGTYVEAFGFNGGYIGIQNNGEHRHDIIFSAWDNGDTDADPNLAGYKKSGTITWAKDPNVVVERFRGEGTGGHVIIQGDQWKPGRWVKFLLNARPEEIHIHAKGANGKDSVFTYTNTLLTAWYKADGIDDDWHFVACHRMAGKIQYFGSGFNSFLEEYTRSNNSQGNSKHKGYYRRVFTRDMGSGLWYNRNLFSFGHTDGGNGVGARNDRYQTALNDFDGEPAIYMQSGGYINPQQGESNLPLISAQGIVPQDIVLDSLYRAEILPAIQKQDEQRMTTYVEEAMVKENMKDWTVHQFSSQETRGDKGAAENAIDGYADSFWHSEWSQKSPGYPHYIALKRKDGQAVPISRIRLMQGRVDKDYCAGSVTILTSKTGYKWTPVLENHTLRKEETQTIVLPKEINTAYIKLQFNAPAPGCNKFMVLNEVNFFTPDLSHLKEVAKSYLDNADQFDSYPSEDLASLRKAYERPDISFAELSKVMEDLAKSSKVIKYLPIRSVSEISSDRAYHIFNNQGYGHFVTAEQTPVTRLHGATLSEASAASAEHVKVQAARNNWMLIPVHEQPNYFYVYNLGYHRYFNPDANELSTEPIAVRFGSVGDAFRIYRGSGFRSPLTAVPSQSGQASLDYSGSPKAATLWNIYDNFSVRPDYAELQSVREATGTQTPTGIARPPLETSATSTITYDLQGRRVQPTTAGIYIIHGKKVVLP